MKIEFNKKTGLLKKSQNEMMLEMKNSTNHT